METILYYRLGLCRDTGEEHGNYYAGLNRDSGKDNGNYH